MEEKNKVPGLPEGSGEKGIAPNPSEGILVDRKQIEDIINRLGKVEEENEALKYAADKSRIEKFRQGQDKKGPNKFRLSTYNGQVIVAWRTVKDIVDKNIATGVYYEHQEYEIILQDGTKYPIVGYNKFADVQYAAQIDAEEVSRTVADESITLKLRRTDTGEELEIDAKFVN